MSSSSSSSASSPPVSKRPKRKHEEEESVESNPNTFKNHSDSDSSSESEDENDKPVTPAEEGDEDAPVLSHAAKRKQKKKKGRLQKQEEDGDADSGAPKKRKLKDGTAASSPKDSVDGKGTKRQNSIWVGNMSFKTTEENLRTFFKGRGVGEITRVNMPTKAAKGPGMKGENRGFAYVDFETPEAKQAAIALSEQPLLGRKLLIKDGDDFMGRPNQPAVETIITVNSVRKSLSKSAQKILKFQKQPPAPTLFFGNLSFDTTEDSIRELLEAHCEKARQKGKSKDDTPREEKKEEAWIRKVRLGTFEDSGKCKGFAFVDFSSTEFATNALVNPKNHHLNGRDLVVEYASAEAARRGALKGQKQKPRTDTNPHVERIEKPKKGLPPHKTRTPNDEDEYAMEEISEHDVIPHSGKTNRPEVARQKSRVDRDKGKLRGRPKPGAALAHAKRESTAIVPSQGQKIIF